MADLVTRLLLNSSQFDNNIRQSTQQIQQFQAVGRNITSTIGKFAGVLGVAMSATEIFDKAVNSSRRTQDDWNTVVGTAKTTVDNFFSSLYTGDWTVFENGLLNAIGLAQEYTIALRNAQRAMEIGETKADRLEAERNNVEYLISKEGISSSQRGKAYSRYMDLSKQEIEERQRTIDYYWEELSKAFQAKGVQGINSPEQARQLYEEIMDPKTAGYQELDAYQKQLEQAQAKVNAAIASGMAGSSYNPILGQKAGNEVIKAKQELAAISNDELNNLLRFRDIFTEEQSDVFKTYIDKAIEFTDKIGTIKKDMSDATQDFENADSGQIKVQPVIPEGSLAELDAQITSARKELNLAISNEDRVRINNELNELTEKKRVIEFHYKFPNAPSKLDNNTGSLIDMTKTQLPDKLPMFNTSINRDDIKINNDYAQSLAAIASVMGSVTNMTNEGAAAWLSWSTNVITAIASAIPAISTLIAAKTAEAGVNAAASATQIPLVGWLMAGAAVASVLAAVATLPSFSEGGIFTGNNTIGDYNLARVNAGEMILNNRQQRNLFNILNGNGIMTSNTGQVEFKIKGKELVGVLANYNNKIAKVR